jgi:CheY-like chemotaxis protein
LAASKIQSQGGSISIEKSDESGTIILISFKLQNMFNNVMLVEDDDVTMMLCKINLKKTNFTPNLICCGNGYEAFNFLKTEIEKPEIERIIPDLIFLDINMPVMNG